MKDSMQSDLIAINQHSIYEAEIINAGGAIENYNTILLSKKRDYDDNVWTAVQKLIEQYDYNISFK